MPNPKEQRKRGSIQSIDRATAILKALASGPRRLGVSELADRLGLARPTVHGLLQTLQAHGFVEQDRHSDKYQLGPGLLQLGYSYLDLNELRARSITYADHLATRTGAAVRVGVMHGASVVVVHHVFRPDAAFGVLEVGLQLPLHASALGKAVLAFSPAQVLEDLLAEPLPRLTKQTVNEAGLQREPEVILRHNANIGYVAGGGRGGPVAEIQLEVSGAFDQSLLTSELEAVPGVTTVTAVPTFQAIYGKRVIVIGGGAQVGMVAQGAISEADRHNIRGERISVDTIPLVGEEQLADAVRAVARR